MMPYLNVQHRRRHRRAARLALPHTAPWGGPCENTTTLDGRHRHRRADRDAHAACLGDDAAGSRRPEDPGDDRCIGAGRDGGRRGGDRLLGDCDRQLGRPHRRQGHEPAARPGAGRWRATGCVLRQRRQVPGVRQRRQFGADRGQAGQPRRLLPVVAQRVLLRRQARLRPEGLLVAGPDHQQEVVGRGRSHRCRHPHHVGSAEGRGQEADHRCAGRPLGRGHP